MSTTIDEKVVRARFDNAQFQQGVKSTLSALDSLKQKLNLTGATKGLENVSAAAKSMTLGNIASGVDAIASKFTALNAVALTALTNITNKAVDAGLRIGKALTIEPIMDGYKEYELNMNSIQTILANTKASGATLDDVNHTLQELNHYADQTVYNFAQMAKNIGTFTAAGVDLETSAASIKGIANLAALSGSSSEQASGAMYQLSQAIAAGKVSLMDWNSVVTAGMGGATFQRALAETAVAMGTIDKGALEISGKMKNVRIEGQSFRDSITAANGESWLTSDVLTTTLKQFTADMTDAELASIGFSAAQIKNIQEMAKTARDSAVEVKTFSGLMDSTKESIVSGWAETWQLVFGDFEEAKKMYTDFGKTISEFVGNTTKARNSVVKDWKELGGRAALIDTVKNAFTALSSVIKPIKAAFRDIFPAMTGKQLADITKSVRDFFAGLKMGEKTAFKVRLIFQGFFAALDIGWIIIKKVGAMIGNLLGTAGEGSGKFLDFAVKIANWVTGLRHALKYGEGLSDFFKGLESVLRVPILFFKTLASVIGTVIEQFGSAAPAVDKVNKNLTEMGDAGESVVDTILNKFKQLIGMFASISPAISEFTSNFVDTLRDGFASGDLSKIVDMFNTGFLGLLTLTLRRFMKDGLSLDLSGGTFDNLNGVFETLTGSLQTMQQSVKATMILKIAAALGILAISAFTLAMIDPIKLATAMGALTVMFAQLAGALLLFDKASGFAGAAKLPFIAAGLILLSVAIGILTVSVKILSTMDWEELAKGMAGLGTMLGLLAGFTQLIANNAARMLIAGAGFMLLGIAIGVFVFSVKQFAGMDWAEMAKGLAGVGAVLGALAIFTRLAALNKIGLSSGAGLILLAVSLKIMASAIKDFGGMDMATLGKGLGSMAVALGLIAGAMALLPKSIIIQAAALVIVASALNTLADVVIKLGQTDLKTLGIGLGSIAAALLVLAGGMFLLNGALAGAAALWIAVDALANLSIVMGQLGALGLEGTIAALATIAGALTILGIAGLVMAPVLPVLQSLGFAILTMGIGAAAAGVGLFMAAAGLVALSATGVAAGVAITAIASAIIGILPAAMEALAQGIVLMAKVIGESGPTFVKAMTTLMLSLLQAINNVGPKIIQTIYGLVLALLQTIANNAGKFVTAGLKLITNLLNGVANNIGKVIQAATNVVTKFLEGMGKAIPQVIEAGYKMVISILEGVTDAVNNNSEAMGRAGGDLAVAIIRGMVTGIAAGVGQVVQAARDMASQALNAAKDFLGIHSPSREFAKLGKYVVQGFTQGIHGNKSQVQDAFESMKKMLVDMMKTSKENVDDARERLEKLTNARHKDRSAIAKARKALAEANKEYRNSSAAYSELTKKWTDDKNRLGQLATQYDALGEKIKAANQKLADAKKTRDDYAASVKNQYADIPDIGAETTAVGFANDLRKQIADTQAFASALQKLRTMGLNDTLYRELLAKGPGAMPFVQDLLATGSTGVSQLNDLSSQLAKVAGDLGTTASKQLYQAAVDSAAGLVKGLQNQQKAIEIQMDKIADAMVAAIKRKLGIKSPSREFMKIGKWSNEGLALGLSRYNAVVTKSAEDVGHSAIESMRKSISGLSEVVDGNLDLRPVISPVLDLTDVQRTAGKIGTLVKIPTISVDGAYSAARNAQAAYHANENAFDSEGMPFRDEVVQETTYNQYINSPKAVSEAEVYRQTKSLISATKGAVNP